MVTTFFLMITLLIAGVVWETKGLRLGSNQHVLSLARNDCPHVTVPSWLTDATTWPYIVVPSKSNSFPCGDSGGIFRGSDELLTWCETLGTVLTEIRSNQVELSARLKSIVSNDTQDADTQCELEQHQVNLRVVKALTTNGKALKARESQAVAYFKQILEIFAEDSMYENSKTVEAFFGKEEDGSDLECTISNFLIDTSAKIVDLLLKATPLTAILAVVATAFVELVESQLLNLLRTEVAGSHKIGDIFTWYYGALCNLKETFDGDYPFIWKPGCFLKELFGEIVDGDGDSLEECTKNFVQKQIMKIFGNKTAQIAADLDSLVSDVLDVIERTVSLMKSFMVGDLGTVVKTMIKGPILCKAGVCGDSDCKDFFLFKVDAVIVSLENIGDLGKIEKKPSVPDSYLTIQPAEAGFFFFNIAKFGEHFNLPTSVTGVVRYRTNLSSTEGIIVGTPNLAVGSTHVCNVEACDFSFVRWVDSYGMHTLAEPGEKITRSMVDSFDDRLMYWVSACPVETQHIPSFEKGCIGYSTSKSFVCSKEGLDLNFNPVQCYYNTYYGRKHEWVTLMHENDVFSNDGNSGIWNGGGYTFGHAASWSLNVGYDSGTFYVEDGATLSWANVAECSWSDETKLMFQADGNLVLYNNYDVLTAENSCWSSNTGGLKGTHPFTLKMSGIGSLAVFDADGNFLATAFKNVNYD